MEAGERGLQQSTAFFQHVNRLPELFARIPLDGVRVVGVAASQAPRPAEGSYMPVFRAGVSWGQSLAHAWGVPFFGTTHQEGHIEAGIATADRKPAPERFMAIHLSGGTTELLDVRRQPGGYDILKLGGTRDLNAGQMVDRIGVAMGFSFPADRNWRRWQRRWRRTPVLLCLPVSAGWNVFFRSFVRAGAGLAEGRGYPGERSRRRPFLIANTLEKMVLNAFELGFPKSLLIWESLPTIGSPVLKYRLKHRAVVVSPSRILLFR